MSDAELPTPPADVPTTEDVLAAPADDGADLLTPGPDAPEATPQTGEDADAGPGADGADASADPEAGDDGFVAELDGDGEDEGRAVADVLVRPAGDPVVPAGIEASIASQVQVHEHRGRTIVLDKMTMSATQRQSALETFIAEVDAELDAEDTPES